MSKESRRRQRTAASGSNARPAAGRQGGSRPAADRPADPIRPGGSPAVAGGGGIRPSTSPTGTPRAGRRERTRITGTRRQSFVERYRTILVALGAIAIVAVVGAGLFSAATAPAYACSNVWVPDPTPSPAEGSSPQPGYVQEDMGDTHVGTGSTVTYTYCPPASGRHWNAQGNGPIDPRVYGPDDVARPQGWVHNLEHGALVVLYRGDGPGATEEGQAAMRAFFDRYPASPVCGFEAGTSVGPVFARFDDMATPFAAVVWGRVLPLDTLDEEAILAFDRAFGEKTNPEKFCEPSASPSASASAGASGSAGPSESATPSASAAPSASPSAAPSASGSPVPSGSGSPAPSTGASAAPSPSAS